MILKPLKSVKSLNSLINYNHFLNFITKNYGSASNFSELKCPKCSKILFSIKDYQMGGYWHYCSTCQKGYDSVSLFSCYQGTNILETIIDLQNYNILPSGQITPDLISKYKQYIANKKQNEDLWEELSSEFRFITNKDNDAFKFIIKTVTGNNPNLWKERVGRWISYCDKNRALFLFRFSTFSRKLIKNENKKLKHTWIIKLCDLPGRICGFDFFTGLFDEFQKRVVSYPLLRSVPILGFSTDEGFLQDHRLFTNKIFIFNKPSMAVKLQLLNSTNTNNLLPVVGCFLNDEITLNLIDLTQGRDITFVTDLVDPKVYSIAKILNARIYVFHKPCDEVLQQFSTKNPIYWLNQIDKNSSPWDEALVNDFKHIDPTERNLIFKYLNLNYQDTKNLVQLSKSRKEKNAIVALYNKFNQGYEVAIGRQSIKLCGNTIISTADNIMMADFSVRIEKIIIFKNFEHKIYKGRIYYGGKELNFCTASKLFNKKPLFWCREYILKNKLGWANYNPLFEKIFFNVITQFYKPAVIYADKFGFDTNLEYFNLSKMLIDADGNIIKIRKTNLTKPHHIPQKSIKKIPQFNKKDVEILHKYPKESVFILITATLILQNLFKAADNIKFTGFHILGKGSRFIEKIAKLMGCQKFVIDNRLEIEKSYKKIINSDWPRVANWKAHPITIDILENNSNVILLNSDIVPALVSQINKKWKIVFADDIIELPLELKRTIRKIIPNFAYFYLKNKKIHDTMSNKFSILTKLYKMYKKAGGNNVDLFLKAAVQFMRYGEVRAITHLLFYLYKQNEIDMNLEGFSIKSNKPSIIILNNGNEDIAVPVKEINSILMKKFKVKIEKPEEFNYINNGKGIKFQTYNDKPCWIISGEYWKTAAIKWNKDPEFGYPKRFRKNYLNKIEKEKINQEGSEDNPADKDSSGEKSSESES